MKLEEIRRRAKIAKGLIEGIKTLETIECGKALSFSLIKTGEEYSCFIARSDEPNPIFTGKAPTPGAALDNMLKAIDSAVSYLA